MVAIAPGPFAPGSISLGLSAVGTDARAIVDRLIEDAVAAELSGFDGLTLSEHHGGFPQYIPVPVTLCGLLLERLDRAWACAGPTVLPLRNPLLLAEELAWTAALHPGRVGLGVAAGYQRRDFELVGADFESRRSTLWTSLVRLQDALTGGQSADDPALARLDGLGLPVVVGIGGPVGARRAAVLGAGILLTSLRSAAEIAPLVSAHRAAAGTGPAVLIRRVHVAAERSVAAERVPTGFSASLADWTSQADGESWLIAADTALITGSPRAVAEGLVAAVRTSGCTALNLRVDAYAASPDLVSDQIEVLGKEVLPLVRSDLGW